MGGGGQAVGLERMEGDVKELPRDSVAGRRAKNRTCNALVHGHS